MATSQGHHFSVSFSHPFLSCVLVSEGIVFYFFAISVLVEHSLFFLSFPPSLFILCKVMHLGSTRCSVILRFTIFLWCAFIWHKYKHIFEMSFVHPHRATVYLFKIRTSTFRFILYSIYNDLIFTLARFSRAF